MMFIIMVANTTILGWLDSKISDLPWASLAITAIVLLILPCACGHLDRIALPFTVLAAALAWFAFLRDPNVTRPRRLLAIVVVVVATLVLTKNIVDVLWYGHSPMLG